MTISFGFEEFENTVFCVFLFQSKGSFDFFVDELNGDVVFVVKGEIMC